MTYPTYGLRNLEEHKILSDIRRNLEAFENLRTRDRIGQILDAIGSEGAERVEQEKLILTLLDSIGGAADSLRRLPDMRGKRACSAVLLEAATIIDALNEHATTAEFLRCVANSFERLSVAYQLTSFCWGLEKGRTVIPHSGGKQRGEQFRDERRFAREQWNDWKQNDPARYKDASAFANAVHKELKQHSDGEGIPKVETIRHWTKSW